MKIEHVSIGTIYSDFSKKDEMPLQARFGGEYQGRIEMKEEYVDGLQGLEEFSHLHLIYGFQNDEDYQLVVKPALTEKPKGIFATRAAIRPNAIGISVVELVDIHMNEIRFKGVDIMNVTPLFDIKPYVHDFDSRGTAKCGWYDEVANTQIFRGLSSEERF